MRNLSIIGLNSGFVLPRTLRCKKRNEFGKLTKIVTFSSFGFSASSFFPRSAICARSALETLLLLMVNAYPEEAELTGCVPMRKGVARPLMQFGRVSAGDGDCFAPMTSWDPGGHSFWHELSAFTSAE